MKSVIKFIALVVVLALVTYIHIYRGIILCEKIHGKSKLIGFSSISIALSRWQFTEQQAKFDKINLGNGAINLLARGGDNSDSMDTTDSYNPERSMKSNAEYTWRQCRNLTREAEPILKYRFDRPSMSMTLTSRDDNSLLFTPIAKCGFTTWTFILYQSAGKLDLLAKGAAGWAWDNNFENVNLRINELEVINQNKMKFKDRILFVRNPFDRLLSAYLDKAVHADGLYTKTHSAPCYWQTLEHQSILTFSQFVECILQKAKQHDSSISSRKATIELDMHWIPQAHLSMPCITNYNMIGKYGHFQEDVAFMIKHLHLNSPVLERNKSARNTTTLTQYYRQLSLRQIAGIQRMYKYDFEIFGFDTKPPL